MGQYIDSTILDQDIYNIGFHYVFVIVFKYVSYIDEGYVKDI